MQKLDNIDNFLTECGMYEQRMIGYKEGNYTLQAFEACKDSWFYVLIYDFNDTLIGVFTIIADKKQTMSKILMAKNTKIVEKLMQVFIKERVNYAK